MTRLGWTGSLFMALGVALGLPIGWGLARQVAGLPGQLLRVGRIPSYKPVEIVPDSVDWPEGDPVVVATVTPPTKKERRKVERDFNLNLRDSNLLGKFELPDMPEGGRAVVSVTKGQPDSTDKPEPVRLTVKTNPPPLVRVRWDPGLDGWYDVSPGGRIMTGYLKLGRLLCIRDRGCVQARAGYRDGPFGDGVIAGVGVSLRF